MFYTLGTAAKATGYTKPTIKAAIDKGLLSASRNEKGYFQIQRSELERVYGDELLKMESGKENNRNFLRSYTENSDHAVKLELEVLREKLQSLELSSAEQKKLLANEVEDLRRRLDESENERRQATEKFTALLTYQQENQNNKKSWFTKLFG